MGTPNNWGQIENAGDWMRQQEKRVMHEARRPRIQHASDLMGPGVAPTAVEIDDWNGPITEFNGWVYSRPGANHAPDGTSWWMGQTITQTEGYGVQEAYDYRGSGSPVAMYTRRFSLVGNTRLFSPWQVAVASSTTQPVTSVAGRTGAVVLVASDITGGTFALARIPTGTTAGTVALGDHVHDTRYYQKSEVDTALSGKAATIHSHTKAQITDLGTIGTAAAKDVAPSGNASAAQVVLGNDTRLSDARTPLTHTHTAGQVTGLAAVATSGSASDITTGTLPSSVLPPLAVNDVFTVATQAAMLALTAQRGDIAVRTDTGKSYILSTDSPGTLADWKELMATGQVVSVAGKTGVVSLVKADVGLDQADNTSDVNKPVSTAVQTALNGKANTVHTHSAADVTSGVFGIAQIPTGTSGTTVALGNHTHATMVTTDTTQTITGQKQFNAIPLFNLPAGVNALNGTQLTSASMRVWHDRLRFSAPTFETSPDGTTWTTQAAGTGRAVFTNRSDQGYSIDNANRFVRWTWNDGSLSYSAMQRMLLKFGYVTPGPTAVVTVWSSVDGVTWTQRLAPTSFTGASAAQFITNITDLGSDPWFRIQMEAQGGPATGTVLRPVAIEVQTARWGDQGSGDERETPYYWDYSRLLGFYNTIRPMSDAVYDLGQGGFRWRDLYLSGTGNIVTLNLTNAITQAKSHASPDTDAGPTSLHHTLGTGANQAAAGNHLHTGVYATVSHTHAIADLPVAASGVVSATQVVRADDSRLSDSRTPLAHTHTKSQITDFAHTHPNTDITGLGTASTRNVPGTGNAAAAEVVLGSDTRLTDARPIAAHASTHASGGSDPVTPAAIGAAPTVHTHAASDVTSGTFDIARIPTGTTSVTVALGSHNHFLTALSDVQFQTVSNRQVVLRDSTLGKWVNSTLVTSDVTNLDTTLAGKAASVHTHTKADVTDLGTIGTAAAKNVPASGNAASTEVVLGSDTRLSDSRTPLAHTHTKANITDLGTIGTAAALNVPASGDAAAGEVVKGSDTRLTNSRTPTAHTHAIADLPVAASGVSDATKVVRSDDARLTDARTPTAHTHTKSNITDFAHTHVKADVTDFAHTHNIADINATGTKDATTFLRGDGTWVAPPGGGGVAPHASTHASGGTDPVTPASIGAAPTTPAGVMHMWPTATAPTGFLLCDGSTFDSGTYPDLAAVLGDTFGAHSGTTYYLPDFRDRMALGAGAAHALGGNDGAAAGSRGTGWDHVHYHQTPAHEHWSPGVDHAHSLNSHTHTPGSLSIASVADRAAGSGNRGGNPISGVTGGPSTSSAGADRSLGSWTNSNQLTATNNNGAYTHPWLGINFIIKT